MKTPLLALTLIASFVTSAHAYECTAETHSGKKVSLSVGAPDTLPGNDGFLTTDLVIKVDGAVVGTVKKENIEDRTNHDQDILESRSGLPSVHLAFCSVCEETDRLSTLKIKLKDGRKFSFTDVHCE